MSIPATKHVVFDVVGTLVSHARLWEAMEERMGDKLKAAGIKPELLAACWIEAAEREYTYLSMSGRYKPFFDVFCQLFYRMLFFSGVQDPRAFCDAEDVTWLGAQYQRLYLREGAVECVQKLRDAGFTVWCFTAADLGRVGGYFREAGVDLPAENLLSCDSVGVAKPDPDAYRPLLERLSHGGKKPWFAAAHMWDVSTARTVG
jgi:2-haloacid dehalogenase